MSDEPLSVAQAAKVAGVCAKSIYRAIARGDLPERRPGGLRKLVLFEHEVAAWRDAPVVPRAQRARSGNVTPMASRRPPERGSLAALRAMERSSR